MFLKKLEEVTPEEISSNLRLVLKEARWIISFTNNWEFRRYIENKKGKLNVIAVIGPTSKGRAVILEVGMKRVTPYNRTRKVKHRLKITDAYYPETIYLKLCQLMQSIVDAKTEQWHYDIHSWMVRTVGSKIIGSKRIFHSYWHDVNPRRLRFGVSEHDEQLANFLHNVMVMCNEEFNKRLHGFVCHVSLILGKRAQKHRANDILEEDALEVLQNPTLLTYALATHANSSGISIIRELEILKLVDNGTGFEVESKLKLANTKDDLAAQAKRHKELSDGLRVEEVCDGKQMNKRRFYIYALTPGDEFMGATADPAEDDLPF